MARAHTSTTTRPTQTIRPAADPADEPPPPPYSRQDPDPDATRVLQEQLAVTAVVEQAEPSVNTDTTAPAEDRERRELEEAMRLSLLAERQIGLDRETSDEDRAARRISNPETTITSPQPHRRTVSDAARPTESLTNQMDQMRIPGDWHDAPAPAPALTTPTRTTSTRGNELAPALSPIRTGSNNPFAKMLSSPTPTSLTQTNNPFADPPRAGSSRTIYAPPPGPPPGHPAARSSSVSGSATATPRNVDDLHRTLTRNGGENPIEILRKYDTVILVDDSGSMAGGRWKQAKSALMNLAEQAGELGVVSDEIGKWNVLNGDVYLQLHTTRMELIFT
jgi:hypothetical protein